MDGLILWVKGSRAVMHQRHSFLQLGLVPATWSFTAAALHTGVDGENDGETEVFVSSALSVCSICTNRGQQSNHLADLLKRLLTQDGTDVGKVCRHCVDLTYGIRNHCGM